MKRWPILFVAIIAVAYALPAQAAEEGLPQFDMTLYPEQLFWLFVSFGALYLLMHFVALPGVEHVQDKRKHVIDEALNAARAANEQAKTAAAEADKALADARAKGQATLGAIKTEASRVAADKQAEQAKQLHQRLRDAETKIAATRDAALQDIESVTTGLAALIVDIVSGRSVKI